MYKPLKANIIMITLIIMMATITNNVNALSINYKDNNMCSIEKNNFSLLKNINKKENISKCLKHKDIEIVNSEITDSVEESITQDEEPINELVYIDNDVYYEKTDNYLTASKGVVYFEGHKETYYSEESLPGYSLNIPGRHVAYDGTIRDIDSYIVVAANSAYLAKGTIINTSLGLAKVYDTGCAYGTIDIYVNYYKFSNYSEINLLDI